MTMERDSLVARLTRAGGAMANILYNLKQQTYGTERIRDQMDEAQLEWDAALRTFQEGSAAAALSRPEQAVKALEEGVAFIEMYGPSQLAERMRASLSALHPAPEAASAGGAGAMVPVHPEFPYQQEQGSEPASAPSPKGVSDGVRDVLAERRRQIEAEGWTPEHDDRYSRGELPRAAAVYALWSAGSPLPYMLKPFWPWDENWLKVTDHRRNLVKAGALILAEIARLDRLSPATAEERAASKEGA